MTLRTAPISALPSAPIRAITAQFDEREVLVYQAYPEALGAELARLGRFGGSWRFDRHTRIQPSWRWTMHRYAWGDRPDRSRLLAIRVHRHGFDALLNAAIGEAFDPDLYASRHAWRLALRFAPVLVEWEADRDHLGAALAGSVPRLVILGRLVRTFAEEWVAGIEDVTAFARAQREAGAAMIAPVEAEYPLPEAIARRVGMAL